ncbi:MAG TPA: hypothetical protein VLU23_00245 [Pseudolabrys sp.]|nr:hypothetical protein [Pseudolabrys sp.]
MTERNEYLFYEPRRRMLDESDRLFAEITRLETAIAASKDKSERRGLERELAAIRRDFAEHLGNQTHVDRPSERTIVPIWLVRGVPSKNRKGEARDWMKQRGFSWDGSAPALRHEVRTALEQGQPVPEGKFGLYVERTVDIRKPGVFIVNLEGEPHYLLSPARIGPKLKMKRHKFGQTSSKR